MSEIEKIPELSERSLSLFKALVEHFIMDGHPVGSRALVSDMELSAATIRNIMADLEGMGLLSSPYTSAGRVPTNRGYRLFVDNLLCINELSNTEERQISAKIDAGKNRHNLLESTSAMLSDITSLASVVMLPRTENNTVQQIEFIPLSDNRILVVLVMRDGEIQNRIIHTERSFTSSELEQAGNYLNENFAGKALSMVNVRKNILADLESMKEHVNQLMQSAVEIAQQVVDEKSKVGDYVIAGETNLMSIEEWCNIDQLKRLFDTFNQKRDILHLLEQSIHSHGMKVFIGEESGYEVLDDCSVVTSPYESEGKILGVLAIIGPTRMHYDRVIPIVDLTAKMLGHALKFE